jgi:hypothetical protein
MTDEPDWKNGATRPACPKCKGGIYAKKDNSRLCDECGGLGYVPAPEEPYIIPYEVWSQIEPNMMLDMAAAASEVP